jgi:hypothetical protein
MQRLGIGVRIDGNSADTHRPRSADDPASNFAPIGDEERFDHSKASGEKESLTGACRRNQPECHQIINGGNASSETASNWIKSEGDP